MDKTFNFDGSIERCRARYVAKGLFVFVVVFFSVLNFIDNCSENEEELSICACFLRSCLFLFLFQE